MLTSIIILLLSIVCLSLNNLQSLAFVIWSSGRTQRSRLSLKMGMGSDVLVRPDDEDSPEFKEYLRQLLRMQANRAGSGFGAPSSGSADAYMAKLTRLKIEQNRRRQLGLPDEPLDTSYRPEDYLQARIEGADPLVSDTVLKGDAQSAQMGKKLRPLTAEELKAAELAEKRIQDALAKRNATGVEERKNHPALTVKETAREPDVLDLEIDKILQTPLKMRAFTNERNDNVVVPPGKTNYAIDAGPKPSETPKSEYFQAQVNQSPDIPNAIHISTQIPNSNKRKLMKSEMELIASTLQLIIKHRGGGPFGKGRLGSKDTESLVHSLDKVYSVLMTDIDMAKTDTSEISIGLEKMDSIIENEVVMHHQMEEQLSENTNSSEGEERLLSSTDEIVSVMSSQIQSLRSLSSKELEILKETLIEKLTDLNLEIRHRKNKHPTPTIKREDRDGIVEKKQIYQPDNQANQVISPKDIKLALGLLLKHRGGPGFGHGRLQGSELTMLEDNLRAVTNFLLSEASMSK